MFRYVRHIFVKAINQSSFKLAHYLAYQSLYQTISANARVHGRNREHEDGENWLLAVTLPLSLSFAAWKKRMVKTLKYYLAIARQRKVYTLSAELRKLHSARQTSRRKFLNVGIAFLSFFFVLSLPLPPVLPSFLFSFSLFCTFTGETITHPGKTRRDKNYNSRGC